jgi:glycosyltransferase involved in cell wall biosynthesis
VKTDPFRTSGRPRVVVLGHSAALSGGELGLVELLGALEAVHVHVILAEDGPLVERLASLGLGVELMPLAAGTRRLRRGEAGRVSAATVSAGLVAGRYAVRLARRLRELRADLVDANTLKAFLYGAAAARLARIPLVWHVRDRIDDDYLPPAAVRLVRGAARWAPTGVIANSRATLASLGPLRARSEVIPSPVGWPRSRGVEQWKEAPLTFAMVGRIAPWKGQDVFVRAFAAAFPRGCERAVIIGSPLFGEDEYQRALELLVDELALGDRVRLCGFRGDVAAELARVDALVHASVIPEPFGRVVVEGMAAGLPVIASGAGGPTEIITDGVDGILYEPGDVHALADALRRVAADEELARRLGNAAVERAGAYAPEAVARRTSDFYRRLLLDRAGEPA